MNQRDRRGQLLLVAALGLAVAFVVLALVLNAVVFTENLATRNHGQTDSVVGYERGVEDGIGGLLAQTNERNNSDYDVLDSTLRENVEVWDTNASFITAGGGEVTMANISTVSNGTMVRQTTQRDFSNANDTSDWTAATGVDATRRFHVVAAPLNTSDPLTINVSDGTASWELRVLQNNSNNSHTDVEVRNGTGAELAATTVEAETAAVDVTEGTVNGSEIEGWEFAEGVTGTYNVSVANGDRAVGRYLFVVDRPRPDVLAALPNGTYHNPANDSYPTTTPAIYDAAVSVSVETSRVTYETNVTVAPESVPVPSVRVAD